MTPSHDAGIRETSPAPAPLASPEVWHPLAAVAVRTLMFSGLVYVTPFIMLLLAMFTVLVHPVSMFLYDSVFRVTPVWCTDAYWGRCWDVEGLAENWSLIVWAAVAPVFGVWTWRRRKRTLLLPAALATAGVMLAMHLVMQAFGVRLFVDTM